MGSEKQTWRNLKAALDSIQEPIHYQRIEDAVTAGVPDLYLCLNGVSYWFELKQLDAFPARASTPVQLHYRWNQVLWGRHELRAGGRYGLITQIGREYFLHTGPNTIQLIATGAATSIFRETAEFSSNSAPGFIGHLLGR